MRFPKLDQAVLVSPRDTFVVPAALDMEQGREAVNRALTGSVLRPFDIGSSTTIDDIAPLWIPFWRVAVVVDGFHVGLSNVTLGTKGKTVPIPTGTRFEDAAVMICARTAVPYEPRLPSLFGRVSGKPALEIATSDLVADPSQEMLHANDAEVVDADVDRARAESLALGVLLHNASPTHAIHAEYEPKIEDSVFCLYPLYYARYTYRGEARRQPDEQLFIAVSGKTGEVVTAKYPSATRSVAAKVRRFLSFDRRGA